MKKIRIIYILIIAFWLSACGKQFGEKESNYVDNPRNEDLIVVGISQIGSESVWRTANTNSIQKVFTKSNGYFLLFDNARQKQANQIKAIRSFISQQVDYIVFSPITENGWDVVLQEAKDAGIPVILMDRQVNVNDESLYTTWVGSNFEEEGRKAGKWLDSYLNIIGKNEERINIVVLQGTEGATSVIGRTDGFNQEAARHSNWVILEQVNGDYTTSKGKEVMNNLLKEYKDIDVVISQNDDMTFGAIEAINEAGEKTGVDGDIILISFDAVKTALEMVNEGIINLDIECNPEQGEYIEKVIYALRNNEKIDKAYYVPEKEFTIDNVGELLDTRTY